MAYSNDRNNNFRSKATTDDRPKNKIITVPMVLDGKTDRDETYDVDQLLDILRELDRVKVTNLISIPVYGNRGEVLSSDAKGTMAIGFLKSIDIEAGKLEVVVYSKYVDLFSTEKSGARFRVIIDKKDKYVRQILGIDLINFID